MTPHDEPLDPQLAALLQRGAPRPALPDDVNARLLRRAAAASVATGAVAFGAAAKVALASVVAVVVTAGGVWTATRAPVSAPLATTAAPTTSLVTGAPAVAPAVTATAVNEAAVAEVPAEVEAAAVAAVAVRSAPPQRAAVVDEVSLLEQARVAIGEGRLVDAEQSLVQHRRQHPRGSLSEEREALMVVTLARRGQTARAQQAASAFHRRFEHSAFAPLVDAALQP